MREREPRRPSAQSERGDTAAAASARSAYFASVRAAGAAGHPPSSIARSSPSSTSAKCASCPADSAGGMTMAIAPGSSRSIPTPGSSVCQPATAARERLQRRLDLAPGLDEEPPAAAGLRPLFEHHRRPGAARHGAIRVPSVRRGGQLPARAHPRRHPRDPIAHLDIAEIAERIAVHERGERGGERRLAGDAAERARGHARVPAARRQEPGGLAGPVPGAVDEPLRLIDEVRRDVDRPGPLDAHVEEPPGAPERGAVDELLQMMDALELDGPDRR